MEPTSIQLILDPTSIHTVGTQLPTAAMNSNASAPAYDEHVPAPTTPPRVIEDADGGFWHYRRGVWWWTMESRPQKRKQAYACTGSKQERKK